MSYLIYLYSLALLAAAVGIIANKKSKQEKKRTYSVVIVARNEQDYLPYLLKSLADIEYPKELYEVILVDDGSRDDTPKMMVAMAEANPNISYLRIDEKTLPGKKEGLQVALELAQQQIILRTDADCVVSSQWLLEVDRYWDDSTHMLIGFAPELTYRQAKKYQHISPNQTLFLNICKEYLGILFRRFLNMVAAGIYAASAGLGVPFSCAGGNLAVDRQFLLHIGGYKSLVKYKSGDDKQLLNLIRKNGGKIRYCPEETVYRLSETGSFIEQQKRRFGKMKMSSPFYFLLTLLVILFHLYLPVYLLLSLDYAAAITLYLAAAIVWLVNNIQHRQTPALFDFILLPIYPYYFIFFTLYGSFARHSWKE